MEKSNGRENDPHFVSANREGRRNFWERRSKLEICLIVISICLLIVMIVLAVLLVTKKEIKPKNDNTIQEKENPTSALNRTQGNTYCTTEKCVTAAGNILKSINLSIDPCENFYDFVCEKWSKENSLPVPKSGARDPSDRLEERNPLIMEELFEKPMSEMKSESEKKVKRFYDSCKNKPTVMEQWTSGVDILRNLLHALGGFMIDNWSVADALPKLIDVNPATFAFFMRYVSPNSKNNSLKFIHIVGAALTLPARTYSDPNDAALKGYKDLMTKFETWVNSESQGIRFSMQEVLEFETELANLSMEFPVRGNESEWEEITLEQLQIQAPFIQWTNYFKKLMGLVNLESTIGDETVIKITAPGYVENMSALVQRYHGSTEQKKILLDYIVWRHFESFLKQESESQEANFCVKTTEEVLLFASGAMFVKETFDAGNKPLMEEMIRELRDGFSEELKGLDWIDQETKRGVEKKLNAMQQYISYPDFIMNSTKLDEYYQDLEIKENDFYANYLALLEKAVKNNLKQEVDATVWVKPISMVNAFYAGPYNAMVLNAGMMQWPYLEVGRPKSINYGSYGTIIGHEITHAFDNSGRRMDFNGNKLEWWTDSMIKKFNEKAECMEKQYGEFEVEGVHVNGTLTLGENIADNGGMRAAYRAYLNTPKTDDDLKPLPGLNFTDRQLFFISFAQAWCTSTTTAILHDQIQTDEHSPNKFRVLGTLSNFEEFSKEFKCKPNSRMNPDTKCRLW